MTSRYPLLLNRICRTDAQADYRGVIYFLIHRADEEFTRLFIGRIPTFAAKLRVDSYMEHSADLDMLCRLKQLSLLDDKVYNSTVARIVRLARETPDFGFEEVKIQKIPGRKVFSNCA